jgi:hypothetical protein
MLQELYSPAILVEQNSGGGSMRQPAFFTLIGALLVSISGAAFADQPTNLDGRYPALSGKETWTYRGIFLGEKATAASWVEVYNSLQWPLEVGKFWSWRSTSRAQNDLGGTNDYPDTMTTHKN